MKEMSDTFRIILCGLLAAIPAYIWGYIYFKKQPEDRKLTAITFAAGMLAVATILLYKYSWRFFPKINVFQYANKFSEDIIGFTTFTLIPIGVILTFALVGVIEEYAKHWVVVRCDRKAFRSVDDAIEFSIIASLGFSFIENMLYFFYIWETQGMQGLVLPFIFRSLFSTFAHIMFSGIYGYFYGVAHFAAPIWQEEIRQNRHPVIQWLHRVLHLKNETLFHEEKLMEGLLIAVGLHAVFNIFLEMNWTFLIVPFLTAGYIFLNYLFEKKEGHKNYQRFVERNTMC